MAGTIRQFRPSRSSLALAFVSLCIVASCRVEPFGGAAIEERFESESFSPRLSVLTNLGGSWSIDGNGSGQYLAVELAPTASTLSRVVVALDGMEESIPLGTELSFRLRINALAPGASIRCVFFLELFSYYYLKIWPNDELRYAIELKQRSTAFSTAGREFPESDSYASLRSYGTWETIRLRLKERPDRDEDGDAWDEDESYDLYGSCDAWFAGRQSGTSYDKCTLLHPFFIEASGGAASFSLDDLVIKQP